MIAGLSWSAWLLLLSSVGLGLFIELLFYVNRKREGHETEPPQRRSD